MLSLTTLGARDTHVPLHAHRPLRISPLAHHDVGLSYSLHCVCFRLSLPRRCPQLRCTRPVRLLAHAHRSPTCHRRLDQSNDVLEGESTPKSKKHAAEAMLRRTRNFTRKTGQCHLTLRELHQPYTLMFGTFMLVYRRSPECRRTFAQQVSLGDQSSRRGRG